MHSYRAPTNDMSDMSLSNFPGSQRDKDAIEQWAELNVPAIAVAAVKANSGRVHQLMMAADGSAGHC